MTIYDKVKRARKHYKENPEGIENMVRKDIEASPDKLALWASLVFNGDMEYMTFGERKAMKTAEKNGITSFRIENGKIIGT